MNSFFGSRGKETARFETVDRPAVKFGKKLEVLGLLARKPKIFFSHLLLSGCENKGACLAEDDKIRRLSDGW